MRNIAAAAFAIAIECLEYLTKLEYWKGVVLLLRLATWTPSSSSKAMAEAS